jgi:hypothetical protein
MLERSDNKNVETNHTQQELCDASGDKTRGREVLITIRMMIGMCSPIVTVGGGVTCTLRYLRPREGFRFHPGGMESSTKVINCVAEATEECPALSESSGPERRTDDFIPGVVLQGYQLCRRGDGGVPCTLRALREADRRFHPERDGVVLQGYQLSGEDSLSQKLTAPW